ncbi:Predicted amidohydrolase [Halobiforma haloterrestris]|uniref:Predicted amidohydrolase n=1 Tax=Natronobacterium haloterrestre TaxID=148448 RepID=A0A1I1JAP0_NATHA|nr:nitrilase-related carbon-nitrogen hydrolase [Halobiforma haloterrestris]SFC42500.1 Predicted amidohydrolase [Halobiforma haloterrestris]
MTTESVRVAVAQTVPEFGAVDRNRRRTLEIVRKNADADLVVLPELATTGYVFESESELADLAEPRDGETASAWAEAAAETGTWIVGGVAERAGASYYNSALVVSPDGLEGVYRKVHPWNEEKRWFAAGSDLPVFETPFGRLGVQICNDQWFPEATITQARAGADLIAVPTNWVPNPDGDGRPGDWTAGVHQAVAHADANRVWIACADRAGTERGTAFEGQSVVVAPDGVPAAGPAPADGEHVLAVDCDLARARDKSLTPRDDALADRRPEVYDLG